MPDFDETPEMGQITEEDARRDPTLLADPSKGNEGILDNEDPEKFVTLEAEAAEEVILAEDVSEEEGEEEGGEVPSQ